ncbi:GntR family transcriptional regulator [Jiella avicenniae]|uniref:GntR family transcriptional regulator n=1 Tax=Jiella avicenniae TaxID=2907202 RepID=A0A9X1P507_9HYPH|nr:GntR family transcriptional regulator [Jiella avicenniae]MCE7029403.1 GntR family transcriptional regulator [Jiella avicenniae]
MAADREDLRRLVSFVPHFILPLEIIFKFPNLRYHLVCRHVNGGAGPSESFGGSPKNANGITVHAVRRDRPEERDMTRTASEIDLEQRDAPRTVSEAIYRRLRSDIIWGVLVPGAPLRSDELRRKYDVGISPLREALSRLASERLVTSSGQRGFRVAPIGDASVVDITRTRLVIECAALERSIEVGDVAWETRVVATHHALSRVPFPTSQGAEAEVWTRRHKAFHMALLSACQSEWQIYLADLLFDQAERFRILRAVKTAAAGRQRDPAKEHQEIVDAVLDRDLERSIAALRSHYRVTMEMALEALASPAEEALQ